MQENRKPTAGVHEFTLRQPKHYKPLNAALLVII